MRILFAANHFNTGGITTYILTLTRGYTARGHDVVIASSGGACVPEAERLGARHVAVPGFRVKCAFHPGLFTAAHGLTTRLKYDPPDIIHAQTRVTQSAAAIMAAFWGCPYLSTCHGFFRPGLLRRLLPLWGRAVIAVSTPVARHLVRDLGASAARVAVVSNGVDTTRFSPADPAAIRAMRASFNVGDEPLIGMVARLSDVKGHGYLIEAMREIVHRVPDVKCLVFGEGPMEPALKEHVHRLGLQGTVLFYRINGRPETLLPMFDVVAVPSLQEGLGLSAMEAQACGVPVVASRVGGLVEAVIDTETGILVPARDHLALADALVSVLRDRTRARTMGQAGRAWITRNFGVDDMVEKTLAVYRKVLACEAPVS